MSSRQPRFNQSVLLDTTPLPDSVPPVKELGASSAPLLSASFFLGARCKPYNDDYMKCKTDAHGTGEVDCLREGRKVTRCAASVIEDINKNCLDVFRAHWSCLDNNNQQLWHCRRPEQLLNHCVFTNLGLKKEIPGAPPDEVPIHERPKQIFSYESLSRRIPDSKFDAARERAEAVLKERKEKVQQLEKDSKEKPGEGSWEKLKTTSLEEVKGKLKEVGDKTKEKAAGK